jgi:hypothetical protein
LCIREKGKNIRRKSKERKEESLLHIPGTKSARVAEINIIIGNFIFCVVKRTVMDFYD